MHFEASHTFEIDVTIEDPGWKDAVPFVDVVIDEMTTATMAFVAPFVDTMEVSVVLTHDEEIQKLNNTYRGKDKPTNVLSFGSIEKPLDPASYEKLFLPEHPLHLGDLIFSLQTLQKESREQNKILEHHFRHLIVHGMLHLLGYDHMTQDDAVVMENAEVEILKSFGILNPYLIQD